jgi:hypothetical protein
MNGDELYASMKRNAQACFDRGETSAQLFKRADEQERAGFSVSAPFTRCLASFVKTLEEGRQP